MNNNKNLIFILVISKINTILFEKYKKDLNFSFIKNNCYFTTAWNA